MPLTSHYIYSFCLPAHVVPWQCDPFSSTGDQISDEDIEFVPPYGSEGALYLRRIGLQLSDEYTLLVMTIPVGNYVLKVRWCGERLMEERGCSFFGFHSRVFCPTWCSTCLDHLFSRLLACSV